MLLHPEQGYLHRVIFSTDIVVVGVAATTTSQIVYNLYVAIPGS